MLIDEALAELPVLLDVNDERDFLDRIFQLPLLDNSLVIVCVPFSVATQRTINEDRGLSLRDAELECRIIYSENHLFQPHQAPYYHSIYVGEKELSRAEELDITSLIVNNK